MTARLHKIRMNFRRPIYAMLLTAFLLACSWPSEAEPIQNCVADPMSAAKYRSTLDRGVTPSRLHWAGRDWRVNAGSTRVRGMPHSLAISSSGERLRVEVHDTPRDNSQPDKSTVRRAELSGSLYGDGTRLPNGRELWGAFSFVHHAWSDMLGMRERQGGVYGQVHMGSDAGGSPALAFRRTAKGLFRITTRGEFDPEGTVQYEAPLSFDSVHDAVYRLVLHPTDGSLAVWIDGERVVDVKNASIGHHSATSYWNIGVYFARGISGSASAEYANHIYPKPQSLIHRISAPPCWPSG